MNTIKKTTLALVGLGAIATTTFTFADDSASVSNSASVHLPMMAGYGQMHQRGGEAGLLKQYFRTDLTDAEKTALATLQKTHQDAVKALFQSSESGSITPTDSQAQIQVLQDQFAAALLPYIATDKQDAFKQFMASMPQGRPGMMSREGNEGQDTQSGSNARPENMNRGNITPKGTATQKSSLLPANISPLVDAKLASFSTNEAKIAWLNGINQKIDVLATKVTAQKSKDILTALKDLLNQKIDLINNVGVDSSILNNLLQ